MKFKVIMVLVAGFGMFSSVYAEDAQTSVAGAKVYFIEPMNGATVSSPFKVKFGLVGMGIAPAGVNLKNTGHHHLLIDINRLPNVSKSLPVVSEQVKHYGGGQTETELTLTPGKHTLQLLLGNHVHVPHDKPIVSEKIMITVK